MQLTEYVQLMPFVVLACHVAFTALSRAIADWYYTETMDRYTESLATLTSFGVLMHLWVSQVEFG